MCPGLPHWRPHRQESAYLGHDVELDKTESICVGCSLGCGIEVYSRDNHLVRIEGNWDASVNHGILCKTGRYLPQDAENWDRVYTPMVRKDGKLKAATWMMQSKQSPIS